MEAKTKNPKKIVVHTYQNDCQNVKSIRLVGFWTHALAHAVHKVAPLHSLENFSWFGNKIFRNFATVLDLYLIISNNRFMKNSEAFLISIECNLKIIIETDNQNLQLG